MSLFKIREFWSTNSEDDEYFDQNSLITTRLNSDSDFVITASQCGVLRIFKPSCEFNEESGVVKGFHPNDLVVEKIFDSPILQVGVGRLISGSQIQQLVILHPRLLSIFSLSTKEAGENGNSQNFLELMYEHKLQRSAANFVLGPFGATKNRDFICVQSLDGILTFFEQESEGFHCVLPQFLLPGPIDYVQKTDSFVTSTSNWEITTYSYKSLSETSEISLEHNVSRNKITSEWSCKLGEPAIDISVIDDIINKETWIMVLGERNLFCLNETGKVHFMKRLEYCPICFCVYVLDEKITSVVISETSTLLVYQHTSLKWSAQLNFLPVCIRRAFLKNIKGAIIALSEEGRLECSYLGTEPSLFVAPPLNVKEVDFEKASEELLALNRIIKNANKGDALIDNIEKDLQVNIALNPELETCTNETNIKCAINIQMAKITITLIPQVLFEEVQVSIFVQRPLKVVPKCQFFSNFGEKTAINCEAFLDESLEIPSLELKVIVSVISSVGVPRTIVKTLMLPMGLVLETCSAAKDSIHKITLNASPSSVPLKDLFPEYDLSQTGNSIAFKTVTGEGQKVTILLAKSSDRYRLQSDSFSSLSLLVEQIVFRLRKRSENNDDYGVSYNTSTLPANELFLYVDEHFRVRQRVDQLQNDLFQVCAQFRLIQKRLIAKFKEKNPTPLKNLELLLRDTYTEVNSVTEKLVDESENLAKSQTNLACAVHLTKHLVKLSGVDADLANMMDSVFCNEICDVDKQAWEDVTDAALCYLLRTVLAKSEKDKLRPSHSSFEEIKDVSKVAKHLSQVLERISKIASTKESRTEDILEESNENEPTSNSGVSAEEEPHIRPIGSQIAESSTRLLSARKSLLRKRHKLVDDIPK